MAHMNKYVDTTILNEKEVEKDLSSLTTFPIVSLLEWPGQSEGEAVVLIIIIFF
jgi:hypothetical protein